MRKIFSSIGMLSCIILLCVTEVKSAIQLPSFFSNNMVLQQQATVKIWGSAKPNYSIVIKSSWDNATIKTKSDQNGKWFAFIQTPIAKEGSAYTITIKDDELLILSNILIGEVWFCSGQSNMEMPLRGFKNQPVNNSNDLIADADNNDIRLFRLTRKAAALPQDNCIGEWKIASPQSAKETSAIAYLYGMLLQKKLKVPVGIIESSWGGTTIQSWMSAKSLSNFSEVKTNIANVPDKELHKYPSSLYNGMIAPIAGFAIKGFLWYQGESNRHETQLYQQLFPAMVQSWRTDWNATDSLDFYYVQIAAFDGKDSTRSGKHLREVQLNCLNTIPKSAMAVILDIGSQSLIHPPEKYIVAKRLYYCALANTYGFKGISFNGPVFQSFKLDGSKMNLTFKFAENGLTPFEKPSENFEIAGTDKIFYAASVKIKSDGTLDVWSDSVKNPASVHYGFKEWVKGDLFNTAGLPASSFRTDNW